MQSSSCVEGDGFPGVTEWHLRVSLGSELAMTSWEQAASGVWKFSRCLRLPFGNWGLVSLAAKSASFQAEIWILSALGRKPSPLLTAHGETHVFSFVCPQLPQELWAQCQRHWMLLMVLLGGHEVKSQVLGLSWFRGGTRQIKEEFSRLKNEVNK